MAGERILVIDDNAINIDLVQFVLSEAGFEVDAASDARAALGRIAERRPDLVLMDIQMPGISGLELTCRLKGDPATKEIRIVAFTAYAMKGDEAKMLDAGCDGYISKPIDVATCAETVRVLLAPG